MMITALMWQSNQFGMPHVTSFSNSDSLFGGDTDEIPDIKGFRWSWFLDDCDNNVLEEK